MRLLTPRSRSHTEPAGDCRVAINAVELTPGCPFAGKVRLKERRNGRQLPRNERKRDRGGRARGMDRAREHVYNVRPRSRLYFAARFAFRLASRGPPRSARRLADIKDVFISVQV